MSEWKTGQSAWHKDRQSSHSSSMSFASSITIQWTGEFNEKGYLVPLEWTHDKDFRFSLQILSFFPALQLSHLESISTSLFASASMLIKIIWLKHSQHHCENSTVSLPQDRSAIPNVMISSWPSQWSPNPPQRSFAHEEFIAESTNGILTTKFTTPFQTTSMAIRIMFRRLLHPLDGQEDVPPFWYAWKWVQRQNSAEASSLTFSVHSLQPS